MAPGVPPEIPPETPFLDLVARLREDVDVIGAVLTGSRGRGAFVHAESDWDLRIFAEGAPSARERYATGHGSVVEAVVMPRRALEDLADPTSAMAWDRYSYVHAAVVVDRTGGMFETAIAGMETLSAESARSIASLSLDDYINSFFRSLKNDRAGLIAESHLDAGESLSPLLTTLFAIHGRVRPFNKFLGWELETHPLPGDRWTAASLLPRLVEIQSTGTVAAQARLFRDLETVARDAGLGEVIDSWEPDVLWLRSGIAGGG